MKNNKLLYTGSEWDFPALERIWERIEIIGTQEMGLDVYPSQIEIISSEQMIDNYASHALPIMYNHWSFGKSFIKDQKSYQEGASGLAYEVVINTNPCIAYLMENNTVTLQALVLAHASIGHNNFFKTNYLFKDWSDADFIIDYLKYAREYISECEKKHGYEEVEELLDACHALQLYGVNKYKKPRFKKELSEAKQKARAQYEEESFNDLWRILDPIHKTVDAPSALLKAGVRLPEENLLYFIEKYSPVLDTWQREIVRIVRKIAQYFYPQQQTQLINEGWATFVHHNIMTTMFDQGYIDAGSYLEFIESHTGVVFQPPYTKKYYRGINVYALGFAMFSDIKRMCMNPDAEDLKLFPEICNTDWLETTKNIVANYRDESFVLQFLGPKVAKQFKLFAVENDQDKEFYDITGTQGEEWLQEIREVLANQYDLAKRLPNMEIIGVDWKGSRDLHINHITENGVLLDIKSARRTVEYIQQLWGHSVWVDYVDKNGEQI